MFVMLIYTFTTGYLYTYLFPAMNYTNLHVLDSLISTSYFAHFLSGKCGQKPNFPILTGCTHLTYLEQAKRISHHK